MSEELEGALQALMKSAKIVGKKVQRYEWENVFEQLRKMKVFTISNVVDLAHTKHGYQQSRQHVEKRVWMEFEEGKKPVLRREDGTLIRYKTAGGNVFYTFRDLVEAKSNVSRETSKGTGEATPK